VNGKDAVKFGYKNLTWGALRCMKMVDLQPDEEGVFTVTLRGKGKGSLGAGWVNAAGRFIINGGGSKSFELKETPQTFTNVVRLVPEVAQKGGKRYYNNIFLTTAGGEIIVENATLVIRKQK
ncbi:MAG: hypothetical protein IKB99_10745, partial [Lentisphaeria bacterium]|nr:hypothetical protein [Lentisphaeria bacterium]